MGREDWFRHTTWDAAAAAAFEARLARARDRAQPLRIQAHLLARSHPRVALALLDRHEALGEDFDRAQALVDRATALVALGDAAGAVAALEAALAREAAAPQVRTSAWLDLAVLVAETGLRAHQARALALLDAHRDRPVLPVERFRAHAARALLLAAAGRDAEARAEAARALAEAAAPASGLARHPRLGLVGEGEAPLVRRVAALMG